MQAVIDEGIICGVYTPKTNNTFEDLKTLDDFLYCSFNDHRKYEKMLPT